MTKPLSSGIFSPARPARTSPVPLGYLVAFGIFTLDVISKYAVHEYTPYGWNYPINGFFNLVQVWNLGAAFSFLADAGGWQRWFFVALAAAVTIWLTVMLRHPMRRLEQLAYSLILAGALGNGIDRAVRGYVVDFLDFHWRSWHWPAFNVADISIFCGAFLILALTFKAGPDAALPAKA